MLSQVKRRLLHPSVVGSFLESAYIIPSVSHFCSENGPGKGFHVSGEISKPVKKIDRKRTSNFDRETSVIDEYLSQVTSVEGPRHNSKKVTFKRKAGGEKSSQKASEMKPGQLRAKMTQAAKDLTANTGPNETLLLNELMEKINTDFPDQKSHKKKLAGKSDQKRDQWSSGGHVLSKTSGDNIDLASSMSFKPAMDDTSDAVNELLLNFSLPNSKSVTSSLKMPFNSIDQLFKSEKPLTIFSSKFETGSGASLKLWPAFEELEMRRHTRFEPLNWFDQCIMWTEEGKLWHFPIDNEQGMDKEAEVDFTEHVFLDSYAESWCPKEGPIRHFMELVLVGLSKNPFLTVAEKKETIEWYHQYFNKHQALLEEINAFGTAQNPIDVEGKLT